MNRDWPVICELSRGSADALAEIDHDVGVVPWSRKMFLRELENPFAAVFGARCEGQLVGFLVCHVICEESHILNFAVRSAWQGRGIGRALLSGALFELHERSVERATLEVRVSNHRARNLYDSIGFTEAGIRPRYYTDNQEDAIVMVLDMQHFIDRNPIPRVANN